MSSRTSPRSAPMTAAIDGAAIARIVLAHEVPNCSGSLLWSNSSQNGSGAEVVSMCSRLSPASLPSVPNGALSSAGDRYQIGTVMPSSSRSVSLPSVTTSTIESHRYVHSRSELTGSPASLMTTHSSFPPTRSSEALDRRKQSQSSADWCEAAVRTAGTVLRVGVTWSGASLVFSLNQCTAQEFHPRWPCRGGRIVLGDLNDE